MERRATVKRETKETNIEVAFGVEGNGQGVINTGIGFFDHMLTLFAKHGFFNLAVKAEGDIYVDGHHTVEDVGIVLGQSVAKALGDKGKIKRYGTAFVPMDEALAMVSLDISGRPYLVFEVPLEHKMIGGMDSELVEEFLRAFALHSGITLHVRLLSGKNTHHIVEAIFKALGRALDEATKQDERISGVMSTKGVL